MVAYSRGKRVQVYFGESDKVGRVPRYQALVDYLRREGAAGATVTRGVAGFGANSVVHTAAILRLSLDLPMVLTWIDAPGRVERLLPGLTELAGSGIVTVEDVEIAAYGGRRLEQLRFDLQLRDVMTKPVVAVRTDDSVRTAVELLVGESFRALPVVDDAGVLVGVLSGGDLVGRAGLAARIELLSAMTDAARAESLDRLEPRSVGDVMTPNPVSVLATERLSAATHLMAERRLKRLPVVDEHGRLVGIVSRADVLSAAGETFPRDVQAAAEHPGALTIGELMRPDAPVVASDADLSAVLDAVTSTRLNQAIVVDAERRVLGVVTDADVLRSVDPEASSGVVGALMRGAGRAPGGGTTAGSLAGRAGLTLLPGTTIAEAARRMTEARVKVACVVDVEGRLLGVVDRADLLRATGDALREIAGTDAGPEREAED